MKKSLSIPLFLLLIGCAVLLGARSTAAAYEGGHQVDREWSPDGTHFAFGWTDELGNTDIYVVDADGSNLRNVTHTLGQDEYNFVWLADSQHMLIPYEESNIVSLETGAHTHLPSLGWDFDLSPDRTRIVYISSESGDLMVMNSDGSQFRGITTGTLVGRISFVDWLPDGQQIMYRQELGADGPCRLMLTDADGGESRSLFDSPTSCRVQDRPKISPDGRYAATSFHVDADTESLFVFDLTHGMYTNLYEQFGVGVGPRNTTLKAFFWSPDGSHLTFKGGSASDLTDIYLYEPQQQRLIDFGGLLEGSQIIGTWSPDGRYLLIMNDAIVNSLYAYDSQTQEFIRVVSSDRDDRFDALWSPDSSSLLVNHYLNASSPPDDPFLVRLDGMVLQPLATPDVPIMYVRGWSSDSQYFTIVYQTYDTLGVLVGSAMTGETYVIADGIFDPTAFQWSSTGHQMTGITDNELSLYEVGGNRAELIWSVTLPMAMESGN